MRAAVSRTWFFLPLFCMFAACGNAIPTASLGPATPSDNAPADEMPAAATAATTESTAVKAAPTLGGYSGNTYIAESSGSAFEYSENVAVTFPSYAQSDFAYTIAGSDGSTPPSQVAAWVGSGKTVILRVRKVPGVLYTLRVTKPVAYTATFTTAAAPSIPAPLKGTPGEPYRYGVLEHPFRGSLGGAVCSGGTCTLDASSLEQIRLLCNAHVRFVRIDYPASQILDPTTSGYYAKPNFSLEDAIMNDLAKCGITELPVILQYSAGPLLTANHSESLPMRYASSYASFAKTVVEHVMVKYPQIKRVELFNEANNKGWGSFPVGGNYAVTDQTGSEASAYMKAAYSAIKSVDRGMTVVGPALADGGTMTDPRSFLKTMLLNRCAPGTCYDVLSVHNYDWENPTTAKPSSSVSRWSIYQTLQQILAQYGHPGVHVMLTEWGYSTIMQPVGFDPRVQARYLALGCNLMLADPTVDGVVYVNVYNPSTDFWGETSLTNPNYSLKPGYAVLSRFSSF